MSESDHPPSTAGRICLLFDREPNQERVSDVLSGHYRVDSLEGVDAAVDATPNLYIVDESFLASHRDRISHLTDDSDSVFQPVLLVTTHAERELAESIWQVIDDVLTVPTQPALLRNRVENLVDRQKLSQQVEDERDKATTLFQRIFQSSNDAICIADIERERVRAANQSAQDLFGYSAGDLETVRLADLYPDYEAFMAFVDRVIEEGQGRTEELRCENAAGDLFHVSLSSSYVEIDGRPHLINNVRDITEQKGREAQRRQSEQYRKRLYEITSDPGLSFDEKLDRVLELGCERLDVANGHLVRIDATTDSHEVLKASGSEIVQEGSTQALEPTYCSKTIESDSVLALHNAPEQGEEYERAFEKSGLATYASSRLVVGGEVFGTVCFVDREPRDSPFSEREKTFIELIARWLSHELERRERTHILNDLHRVSVDLLTAETREEIVSLATEAVEDIFGIDIAIVYLVRADGETLDPVATSPGAQERFDRELPSERVGTSPLGGVFEGNESVPITDLDDGSDGGPFETLHSMVGFPLRDHGILLVGSTEMEAIGRTDREELELLATNTAAALTRTDREQQLREAHQHRSKLFENSTDCVVEIEFEDWTPIIRDVNPAFESVFGFDRDAVRGDSLQRLIVPPDRTAESDSIITRARRGEPFETEVRRETADGRRDFLFRGIPIEEDGKVTSGYAVYTDITERRRQEQQVQVLNRILRHNLNNKVNVIHGYATRIQDQVDGPVADAVTAISEASEELLDLSEKTTQFRKANKRDPASDDINVVPLIEELIADIRDEYGEMTVTVDAPDRAEVVGGELLRIAFHEVLENAVKHAAKSDPTVEVTVTEAGSTEGWTEITITDDGPGIPAIEQDVLKSGLETPLQHGSGLGLWLVNWIIKSLGGDFTVETPDGSGSKVTFHLPQRSIGGLGSVEPPFEEPEW